MLLGLMYWEFRWLVRWAKFHTHITPTKCKIQWQFGRRLRYVFQEDTHDLLVVLRFL